MRVARLPDGRGVCSVLNAVSNAQIDRPVALESVVGPQHPCYADGELDHDWQFVDESFDHAYGTERVHFWRCERCDATRGMEAGDYDDY